MGAMTTPVLLVAASGVLLGAGLWLALASLAASRSSRGSRAPQWSSLLFGRQRPLRLIGAIAGGLLVWFLTGWPVAGVLVAAGCWWGPIVLGPDRRHQEQVDGVEAVAAWTEMLRDLMAGAAGLHQAVAATVPIAPEPVREPVARLAERLRAGRSTQDALRSFADEVDNPTADLVTAALSTAATRHATDLGTLLGSLAEAAREQAAMLVRVAASRARLRTSTRIIVGTTVGMAAFLLVINGEYMEPLDGFLGQLVLAGIGCLWTIALVWLSRMSRFDLGPRVLAPEPAPARTSEAVR
ncbi:type II secretion system F family protein [Nocardiopsis sp. CT-R113]|uniref:Type II secretion system F family protein n=1 Tax=Nocardiopsis codii TaxID=3065942 RepID=A0ABU7K781_9ACTN|nr:type II secretion system F family protein [Nocardiopsis sp. CT-R113]MEE2038108.1 type II secretion system F family protein [Nocardiopsis sp. CT-R113]